MLTNSKEVVEPAAHSWLATTYELPDCKLGIDPRPLTAALGTVLYVVCCVAGEDSSLTLIPPWPLNAYAEVSSAACSGKRKTSEHVLPAYDAGRSKLKMVLSVGVRVPLYCVPYAVSGWAELTGTIRCGYWYSPLRLAGQLVPDATAGVVAELVAREGEELAVGTTEDAEPYAEVADCEAAD